MAFPWDNLITGASTLIAGLGGIGLKGRIDRKGSAADADRDDKSARTDRVHAAYAELVTNGTDMVRCLNAYLSVRKRWMMDHTTSVQSAARVEEAGARLARSVTSVQLIGSAAARAAARAVHSATVAAAKATAQRDIDQPAAEAALGELFRAIDAFVDAVRPETTS